MRLVLFRARRKLAGVLRREGYRGGALGSLFSGVGSDLAAGLPVAAAALLIALAAGGAYWAWAEE